MPRPPNALAAAAAMVAATGFFAGTTLIAKALGSGALGQVIHPLQVSQARFVFGFLAVLAVALSLPRGPAERAAPSPHWALHLGRTALGWLGGALLFAAAARMPLTDANALSFLSPAVTMLLAVLFLSERVGPWRWAACAVAFLGALILIRPGAGAFQPAALLALGAAVAMGAEGIFIKRLADRAPPRQILVVNNAMGAALATAAGLWVFDWPLTWPVLAALAGVGLLMVAGQFLFLLANARGEASYLAPFFFLSLVWAAVYDFGVFGVLPDRVSVLGASVVVAGGLLLAWREALARRHARVISPPP